MQEEFVLNILNQHLENSELLLPREEVLREEEPELEAVREDPSRKTKVLREEIHEKVAPREDLSEAKTLNEEM